MLNISTENRPLCYTLCYSSQTVSIVGEFACYTVLHKLCKLTTVPTECSTPVSKWITYRIIINGFSKGERGANRPLRIGLNIFSYEHREPSPVLFWSFSVVSDRPYFSVLFLLFLIATPPPIKSNAELITFIISLIRLNEVTSYIIFASLLFISFAINCE